jgi:putative inorganic carbon (hco3(-)) transporter
VSALRLQRLGGYRGGRRSELPRIIATAIAGGIFLGGLAVAYEIRHKTTTDIAIGAVVVAMILVIAGNPRQFMLAIVAFDLPLEWGKYTHWDPTLASVGEVPGFQISLTTIALAGLYAMWALHRSREGGGRPLLRPALPLILYLAFNVASLFGASNKSLSVYMLVMLAQTLLLFIYVVSTFRTRADVRLLITALLAGALLESLLILVMYATGFSPNFLGLKNHVDTAAFGNRIGGTFGTPNGAAAYLCLMLPLALGVLVSNERGNLRSLAIMTLPVGLLALVITQSRGGWISFALSAGLIAMWAVRQKMINPRTVAVAGLGVVLLIVVLWGPIGHRLLGSDGGSASSRVSLAQMAEQMIKAKPLFGVGVNNYGINLPKYASPRFDGAWMYTVHDRYLLVWAEAGVFALIAYLTFLGVTLRRGWVAMRRRDPWLSPIVVGLTAAVAGQMVHMAVDIFQDRPQVEGLWLTAALITAIELITRREAHRAASGINLMHLPQEQPARPPVPLINA